MLWFKRNCGQQDYSADQAEFAELYRTLGRPQGMVMILANEGAGSEVYIHLPERAARETFGDYEPVAGPPGKSHLEGLFGRQEDLLKWISRALN